MRKQLLICVSISGLAATGLLVWHQPARAADAVKTIHIVFPGPVFDEPNVIISAGQSIKWVADDAGVNHHLVDDGTGKEITPFFHSPATPTHKFETGGGIVVKYHCTVHPDTMVGTITVN
jgi:plastocyanin